MKKDTPNKAKIIFEENDYPYFQDHSFLRGIPAGIEFEIDSWQPATARFSGISSELEGLYKIEVNQGALWLSAPGYGRESYGNGPIAIRPATLFKKAQVLMGTAAI